ncbi:MAG: RluA family pseudouridine synthase [Fuerstiella sp.]|nr:RluA family pseudouridine synthase [Fuerstiella sp.]
MSSIELQFKIEAKQPGKILAELRRHMPGKSWSDVRRLLQARLIAINGVLCIDEGRTLTPGETIRICGQPLPPPPADDDVAVKYVDHELVIAEKPSGMTTLRRHTELSWSESRRRAQPTLDESVARLIARHAALRTGQRLRQKLPRLLSIHRIDRDTSGLVVFARNEKAQQLIISQFAEHMAVRKYLCVIQGSVADQTITSQLVRNRGDGLRGSSSDKLAGQQAVTHVRTLRTLGQYSELECTLETGRTNQIRIHLAELGHPVCGDIKYRGPLNTLLNDSSNSPRLALHASVLRLRHPVTDQILDFHTSWPLDMQRFLNGLRVASR